MRHLERLFTSYNESQGPAKRRRIYLREGKAARSCHCKAQMGHVQSLTAETVPRLSSFLSAPIRCSDLDWKVSFPRQFSSCGTTSSTDSQACPLSKTNCPPSSLLMQAASPAEPSIWLDG